MKVLNQHQRLLPVDRPRAAELLDSLASSNDRLWPASTWPAMRFDRPLEAGAVGGHGPIRYTVASYIPGQEVRFRFTGPGGFDGGHRFELIEDSATSTLLRHTVEMRLTGAARLTWPLLFGPLHDALLEDCLANAQRALGCPPEIKPWSPWVRLLRRLLAGKRARPQRIGAPQRP